MGRELQSGYTTGTCASAAAMAAAVFVLEGSTGDVCVRLANKATAAFTPEYGVCLAGGGKGGSWCRVKKDAGDDPDVTDGVWVYAGVFPVSQEGFEKLCREGAGYVSAEYPRLYLNGGPGIGIVQKEGLSCPVGHYAINPVPQKMILQAVSEVCKRKGCEGYMEIRVAIPDGALLAEKTFNPRMGIRGGISVLGTTGVVEPMSERALMETIRLDIRMKRTAGEEVLLLTPGNYGEVFLEESLGVPLGEAVKCSNFIRDSVVSAEKEGFKRLLLVGHIGKLAKVARGAGNTHSRYGDGRMEMMGELFKEAGQCLCGTDKTEVCCNYTELAEKIGNANTTEEAVGWLKECGLAERVLSLAAGKVKGQVECWADGRLEAEVAVFSSVHRVMGESGRLRDFLQMRKGEA